VSGVKCVVRPRLKPGKSFRLKPELRRGVLLSEYCFEAEVFGKASALPVCGRDGYDGDMRICIVLPVLVFLATSALGDLVDLTGVTGQDPEFGPWYGHRSLYVKGTNALSTDAGRAGRQDWPFLGGWLVHGPAAPSDWQGAEPGLSVPVPAGRIDSNAWKSVESEIGTGWTHLALPRYECRARGKKRPKPPPADSTFWATTTVRAADKCELYAAAGVDGRAVIWINDRRVASGPKEIEGEVHESVILFKARLRKGINRVLVRCHANGQRSKLWLRICVAGRPRTPLVALREMAVVAARLKDLDADKPHVFGYRLDGTAFYEDADPVTAWDLERNINVVWRTPLFWSKAQPIITGERVFVTEEPQTLTCLDKGTGRILWQREPDVLEVVNPAAQGEAAELRLAAVEARKPLFELGASPWERLRRLRESGLTEDEAKKRVKDADWQALDAHEKWTDFIRVKGKCVMPLVYRRARTAGPWTGFSFGTPVTDGKHVWVKFGTGVIACYDMDGNRKWMAYKPLVQSSGSECTSPILVGGPGMGGRRLLVVQLLHKQKHVIWMLIDKVYLVALDADTGEEVWRADALDFRPNSTPTVVRLTNGKEDMTTIVTGSGTVVGASDGKVLVPRMMGSDGYSSPTLEGDVIYRFGPGLATGTRLIMQDPDHVGFRTLWARQRTEHSSSPACVRGLLFGLRGDQKCLGYRVYDAATGRRIERRANRDIKNVGATKSLTVWIPTAYAGGYVFLCDRGARSGRYTGDWANVSVLQAEREGRFVAHNLLDRHLDAPLVFEGDRIYARTDRALTCLGRVGAAGAAYEAEQNAERLLDDIPPEPPPERDARRIEPVPVAGGKAAPFAYGRQKFFKDPWLGPLHAADSEAVVARLLADGGAMTNGYSVTADGKAVTADNPPGDYFKKGLVFDQSTEVLDASRIAALSNAVAIASTLAENDRKRTVRVILPGRHVRAWLSGRRIKHHDRLELLPGTYPLLVCISRSTVPPAHGALPIYIRFEPSVDQDAEIAFWHESVKRNRGILENVVKLAPDTPTAARARAVLEMVSREARPVPPKEPRE